MNSASELDATYYGFIGSTYDALILFEACIAGQIKHVSRRPHDLERGRVIQSGSIFIYEENASGIKRWTDGISWSPSRILGNFLIYRQLVKGFGPGEKKRAIKKSKAGPNGISKKNSNSNSRNKENIFQAVNNFEATGGTHGRIGTIKPELERALIGSLTDSYDFLEDGLVKKTISVNYGDVAHHLVSYYTVSDVVSQTFTVPSKDPRFAGTYPRASLLTSQNFRYAIEDIDPLDYPVYPRNRDEMTNQGFLQSRTAIMPALDNYSSNGRTASRLYSSNYNTPIALTAYENGLPAYNLPAYKSTIGSTNHHVAAFGRYPTPQRPDHHPGDFEPNLAVAGSAHSDGTGALTPTAGNLQRDVSFFHQRDSQDSGISMPRDKTINDSNFGHKQNGFYGFPRDLVHTTDSTAVQKTPPSSLDFAGQVAYEGSLPNGQKHQIGISLDSMDMWQVGNASVGHGHY